MMIILKHVTKEYDKKNVGLYDISFDVSKGEFVFIVGKSGSGKTTLMKLLQKELDVTSGQIIVNGQDYAKLNKRELPKLRRQMGEWYFRISVCLRIAWMHSRMNYLVENSRG